MRMARGPGCADEARTRLDERHEGRVPEGERKNKHEYRHEGPKMTGPGARLEEMERNERNTRKDGNEKPASYNDSKNARRRRANMPMRWVWAGCSWMEESSAKDSLT